MNADASSADPGPETPSGEPVLDPWQARLLSIEQEAAAAAPEPGAWAGQESWADPCLPPAPGGPALRGIDPRYRPLAFVGEGATSWVFKGLDTLLERTVALKVLKPGAGEAFREARAQALVDHPNICGIHEVGDGYLVLQWVTGRTLGEVGPGLPLEEKVRIVREAALGVDAAHAHGLVHLDLKLDNLLMHPDPEGRHHPVIGDFGMVLIDGEARARTCPKGTPPYSSPEQLRGDPDAVDRRSDVYSLGVILYILLTGALPWEAASLPGLLKAMGESEPCPARVRNPGLAVDLAAIVHRCLRKVPEGRYPTAAALADDLSRFLAGQAVQAMGGAWGYRLRKWAGRNRRTTWVGLAAMASLLAGALFLRSQLAFVNQQAEWDHVFQKRVEDIRACLDHAYRLPRQNVEGDLQRARRMAADLAKDVKAQGRAAQGPGHLALGQVRLLIDQDTRDAELEFVTAWNLGYRTHGAKVWQAFALVQRFRREAEGLLRDPRRRMNGAALQRLDANYLAPAREFLRGRQTSEELLLGRLVETAHLFFRKPQDFDPLIQALQTYRQANPADIDAWLEEGRCMSLKAGYLAAEEQGAMGEAPGPGSETAASVHLAVRDLMRKALEVAPSCPKVYGLLAISCLALSRDAHVAPPDRATFVRESRRWTELGLGVSPRDEALQAQAYLNLAGQMKERLAAASPVGSVEEAWRKLANGAWEARNGRGFGQAIFGAYELAEVQWERGEPGLRLLNEALDRWGGSPGWFPREDALGNPFPWLKAHAGEAFIQSGLDPGRLDGEGQGGPGQPAADPADVCGGCLVQAEHALLTGGEAGPALRRCEDAFKRVPPSHPSQGTLRLELDLVRAWTLDTEAAWRNLDGHLDPGAPATPLSLWLGLRAQLSSACHERNQGRPVPALRDRIRSALEPGGPRSGPRLPPSLAHEAVALACLLDGRAEALRTGLEEIRAALDPRRGNPGQGGASPALGPPWVPAPHPGRSLAIEGELQLALARLEASPRLRHRRLALARRSFQRALAANPNLRKRIGPRLAELARHPSSLPGPSGPGIHDDLPLLI